MGDMKTPDFDDLLAAFNIPDMVDPKAAIESGHHDMYDGQLKQSSGVTSNEEKGHSPSTGHDIGISVIVKNIRNTDIPEHGGTISVRDGYLQSNPQPISVGTCNGLHNGVLNGTPPSTSYNRTRWKAPREEGQEHNNQASARNQFSPISSAEEFEVDDEFEMDDPKIDNPNPKSPVSEKQIDTDPDNKSNGCALGGLKSKKSSDTGLSNVELKGCVSKPHIEECEEAGESPGLVNITNNNKSSDKLPSCITAITALGAKKASATVVVVSDSPVTLKESNEANEHHKAPQKPQEFAKRLFTSQQHSTFSVTNERSSKECPSSSTAAAEVVPKVRIKTTKTSSGQIKRTVTRVLREFDPEDLKKGDSSPSLITTTNAMFSSPARSSLPTTMVTKQMTIKPIATAFLPVSAVKTAGSQVINLKLANNTTVKATVIPAASVQSASSVILKATNVIQQQTVILPASSLTSANLVPKTVHHSEVNPLPQSESPAGCDLQLSSMLSHQQSQCVKRQAGLSGQGSKNVSRVQVFTSSQSSVVEEFNHVLSSLNPVPVYVPNLSPPTSASVPLPLHGHKCLECGDSFALERSLTQHYQRRSVQIEVACNHCAKNLVFYNKCRLLSHARGHKDKGVAMQCSHLILKPIPAAQMLSALSIPQTQAATSPGVGKGTGSGSPTAVISASCNNPLVAALALENGASKLCKHSLKCPSRVIYKCSMCDTVFTLQSLLYTHFDQHVVDDKVSVFKCPDCSMHYTQKQLMLDHIRNIHGTLKTAEDPPNLGINLPLSVKPSNSNSANCAGDNNNHGVEQVRNRKNKGGKKCSPSPQKNNNSTTSAYTCGDCGALFTSREVFVAHVTREHGKILKKHPCRQCDKSFSSSHSLCRHNRLKHKGLQKVHKCLRYPAHVRMMHGVKEAEGKNVSSDNVEVLPHKKTILHLQSPSPKRKPEEDEGSPSINSRPSDSQPLKRLKVNVLKVHKCALCGFTTEDISTFHKHIPQHKSDGSSDQCQECGLCYTSHGSLARHLFIVHRLKEPRGLARYNGRGKADESQRENQKDIVDETRKCKVCGKRFETEANLNTHMRTHGMAFIKSKRLTTAEK